MACVEARCRGAFALHRYVECRLRLNVAPCGMRLTAVQQRALAEVCAAAGEACLEVGGEGKKEWKEGSYGRGLNP